MAFSATKFSELPLSSHFLLYSTSKPSYRVLKTFCALRTTHTNNGNRNNRFSDRNRNPRPSRRGSGASPSAPWLNKWPPRRADSPDRRVVEPERRDGERTERPKTAKDRGQNAIERIVLRLRNLGLGSDDEEEDEEGEDLGLEGEEVTGDEKLGDLLQREWIRPDFVLEDDKPVTALPWERENDDENVAGEGDPADSRPRRTKAPTMAELTIEDTELRRLRRDGMTLRDRISVPKAGITQAVLDKIHDKWRKEELVRLKFHEVLAHDMKTAHEIVERRTGGLVLWRSGSVMVVYRGSNYNGPLNPEQLEKQSQDLFVPDVSSPAEEKNPLAEEGGDLGSPQAVRNPFTVPESASVEEIEFNKLLDELGPRFYEYWGTGILPVDADLLPQKIPDYKTPYRVLPSGMRSRLTNGEMTNLRKLAKSIPCHFALGRNRNHQGLAKAILRIWETSLVAKIAVKRGIQNTNNKLMADELKNLTGGVLLLRNKYYIVIYRGKDFLPTTVAAALADRQKLTKKVQDVEEQVRIKDIDRRSDKVRVDSVPLKEDQGKALAGTLAEFYEAQARWGIKITSEDREKMLQEAAAAKHAKLVKRIEHKLSLAQAKKLRAEKLLYKIEASLVPAGPDYDQETITDEERVMFRRVGLKMKAYLPLGIRGVFDGVIENMHLHWKHRELVKLISKQKTLAFVEDSARLLEYESGGILVAIVKVPKGYALIYYRGKNYRRPFSLRPRNLLTKAKALKRSVAMQRHEALSQHISELERTCEQMTNQVGASQKRHEDRQSRERENTSALLDNNDEEGPVMDLDDDFDSEEDDEGSAMDSDDNDDDYDGEEDDDDDDSDDSYSEEEIY